ncbi:MAG: elongation factor 1-beta [Nanoarchaeota archaeon]
MAVVAIKIKIMPESLDVSLPDLQIKLEEKVSKSGAMNVSFTEENVAFGLKALIIQLAWPEEKDTNPLETDLSEMEGVSSAQIIDYRRAFG